MFGKGSYLNPGLTNKDMGCKSLICLSHMARKLQSLGLLPLNLTLFSSCLLKVSVETKP